MHPILLVIEDDASTKSFLENILTDQGYIVKSATKGTSGLQLLSELTPDLVLLDLELPDIHGESGFISDHFFKYFSCREFSYTLFHCQFFQLINRLR